jgi:hypothetical protein
MPKLISIAVENPEHYIALDSESNAWRGQLVTEPRGPIVIRWERVMSDFLGSSESKSHPRVTFKVTGPQKKGRLPKGSFTLQPPKKGRREED